MDSTELCKKFKERLDSVIKSDEQITEVEMEEFDEVSDMLNSCFKTVSYKNQFFTIECWDSETGIGWHLLCDGVDTEELDVMLEDSIYVMPSQVINSETEIEESVSKIMYGIKTYFLSDNLNKIIDMSKNMSTAITNMKGLPEVNKFLLSETLKHYKLIDKK
jgi:hypothetical protein